MAVALTALPSVRAHSTTTNAMTMDSKILEGTASLRVRIQYWLACPPGYDREAVARLLGRRGHIALEVHDNPDTLWMGVDRWLPGRVVRYRNIAILPLD